MRAVEQSPTRFGIAISKLFIRVMFRQVQGWERDVPSRAEGFVETASDGSKLEGAVLLANPAKAKGVVLLCHPFLKYGMHYFFENGIDQVFLEQGYHVIAFNFKGFGRSTIGGHAFADDVLSIARKIAREYPGLPIHLVGCSFGGYHLSHALARDASPFTSAVLDSVPVSVRSYFTRGPLRLAMRWISGSRLAVPTGTCAIDHSLKSVHHLPIAYFYGLSDRYIPEASVTRLSLDCTSLHVVGFEACRHLENHKKHRDRYFQEIFAFFVRAESHKPVVTA
ncbi:alpha/beta hydrolase [Pseudomonas putida]|uniref:Alpha/beta fold hydrolase n=1 Tax=Pseudomonas putida TaxID=303 RepID=A0AAW5HKP4_PSEPU|nr:alpha/beta fold hydrolase [Pseudomonas putida]MCO1621710.1 alpha/beta fold hydrolase [Pseudomonas putida]